MMSVVLSLVLLFITKTTAAKGSVSKKNGGVVWWSRGSAKDEVTRSNALLRGYEDYDRFKEEFPDGETGGETGLASEEEEEIVEEQEEAATGATGATGGEDQDYEEEIPRGFDEPLDDVRGKVPWTMAEAISRGMQDMCSSELSTCSIHQMTAIGLKFSEADTAPGAHCDVNDHPEIMYAPQEMAVRCRCLNSMFDEPVDESHDEFNCCFPGENEHLSISYMIRACKRIAEVPDKCKELIGSDLAALSRVGDGRCDLDEQGFNTESCNWDGGDCCVSTCTPFALSCQEPFDCRDPATRASNDDDDDDDEILPTGTASGCGRFAAEDSCNASPECEWIEQGCAYREIETEDRIVSTDFEFGVCQDFKFEESNLMETKDQICIAFEKVLDLEDDVVVELASIDRDVPSVSVHVVLRVSNEDQASSVKSKMDALSSIDLEIELAKAGAECDMNVVSQGEANIEDYESDDTEQKTVDGAEAVMDDTFSSGTGSFDDDDDDVSDLSGEPKLMVKTRLVLNGLTTVGETLSQVRKAVGDALATCLLVDRNSVVVMSGNDNDHVSLGVLVMNTRDGVSIAKQICELDMVDFEKDVCDLLEMEGVEADDTFESMDEICSDMFEPEIAPVRREESEKESQGGPIEDKEEEEEEDFEATGTSSTGTATGGVTGGEDLFDDIEVEDEKELEDLDLEDMKNVVPDIVHSGWEHKFPSGPSSDDCKMCSALEMMHLGELALSDKGVKARCPASIYEATSEPDEVKFDRWCECLVAIQDQMFKDGDVPETLEKTKDWNCCVSSKSTSTLAAQLHMCRLASQVPETCENVKTPWNIGDGRCDVKFNTAECEYDGGDCCPTRCVSVLYDCDRDRQQSCGPAVVEEEQKEEVEKVDDGPYGYGIAHGVHVSEKQVSFVRIVPGVSDTEKEDTVLVKIQILQSEVEDAKKDVDSLLKLFDNAQILTAALDKVGLIQGVSAQLISSPELVVLHTHESAMKAFGGLKSPEEEKKRETAAELSCVTNLEDKLEEMKTSEDLKLWCLDLFDERGMTEVVGRDTLDHVCSMVSGEFQSKDVNAICKNFHVAVDMFIGGEPDSTSGQSFPTKPSPSNSRQQELKDNRCKDHPERPGCNRDPCSPHESKGCDDVKIERCVCKSNSFCCEQQWDTECVVAVTKYGCSDRCRDPKVTRYDDGVLGQV